MSFDQLSHTCALPLAVHTIVPVGQHHPVGLTPEEPVPPTVPDCQCRLVCRAAGIQETALPRDNRPRAHTCMCPPCTTASGTNAGARLLAGANVLADEV